jgi:serine/threonine-protein kinase
VSASRLRGLARVAPGDPGYRAACVEAIRLADGLDSVGLEVENLLAEFIRSGPATPAEDAAFLTLAGLYLRKGFSANAVEAAAKLLRARPGHAAAEALILAAGGGILAPPVPVAPPTLPPVPQLPRTPTRRLGASRIPGVPPGGAQPLAPGMRIASRYELADEIGRGGMSVVYRARDSELGEDVALKFLTGASLDADADARFKQELKLSRQLVHPNIVRLYDLGQHQELRFISMELLAGMDVARILRAGPLAPGLALDYLIECCTGLQAAHDRGIIHRDIKPANLFVTSLGELKVMDFGIAKLQNASGPALTSADVLAGTPAYLAPEQIRGFSEVTPAADLYALGVVAYEMLTGTVPFSHPEAIALLMLHIQATPPPLRERRPGLPVALEALVLRLLEKAPEQRFASCRELGVALAEIRRAL